MARLDPVIAARVRRAMQALDAEAPVKAAYVFGSQINETADKWSDIDVAAFITGVEQWDIERRAAASARVQRLVGDDIELHLLPDTLLTSAPSAGFAAYVKRTGVSVDLSPKPA